MLRKIVLLSCMLFLVCYAATIYAQTPQILNFQGRLNDSSGQPAADGNYAIQFLFYPAASGGTAVWIQTQTVTTKNGIFNVLLSNVNLDLSASEYYLAMKVGSDAEMTPRQRIASVPYALQAKPVALVGRVLCKVSMENGQIQTGDLLTTAAIPDHAMKATDFERRQGAILGKALQAFDGDT